MKNYNSKNYAVYKEDLEISIRKIEGKFWDEYTRDELVTMFMPLVENLARKFSTSDSASGIMTVVDMIQEGSIGLIKAVDKISWETIYKAEDPEKRLKSFLAKRIKGSIRRATDINRGSMRIPEHKLNEIRKSDSKEAAAMFFNSVFTSIDALKEDDSIFEIPDITEGYDNATLNKFLLEILNKYLTQREADVVRMSFGLDCDKKSASEIAKHLNIKGSSSYVRVSQLKKQAIDKLKQVLDHSQVVDYL